jgi:hypothetical protein
MSDAPPGPMQVPKHYQIVGPYHGSTYPLNMNGGIDTPADYPYAKSYHKWSDNHCENQGDGPQNFKDNQAYHYYYPDYQSLGPLPPDPSPYFSPEVAKAPQWSSPISSEDFYPKPRYDYYDANKRSRLYLR